MIAAILACTALLQQRSPTTPIVPPGKKVVAPKLVPPRVVPPKVVAPKKKPVQKPVVNGGLEKLPVRLVSPGQKYLFKDSPAGSGQPAKAGDLVVIHFHILKKNGGDVADSKRRGLPYTLRLGDKGNDALLETVVKGMKPGGVRTATILASDVYGSEGAPSAISPNDILKVTITFLRRGDQ